MHKAWLSSNFGLIRQLITELAAIERLKISRRLIKGTLVSPFFSVVFLLKNYSKYFDDFTCYICFSFLIMPSAYGQRFVAEIKFSSVQFCWLSGERLLPFGLLNFIFM